ncbi:unnamed protein product [Clavelina lepadiformis]|uniref:SRCR domain-containing protein n=1 Tax=Clavelina lepadiformis TaxID=159417 RepID=A0ABP0FZF2_CLALP
MKFFGVALTLILSCCNAQIRRQATCEIDVEAGEVVAALPGKRGPSGAPGIKGTKGEPGDCKKWITAVESLEQRLSDLQNELWIRDWSTWTSWGECSTQRSCGIGSRSRSRTCLFSRNGGPCEGSDVETGECRVPSCDASVRLLNGTFGPVFIYDDSNSEAPKWRGVCEYQSLSSAEKTGILKAVCRSKDLSLAYIRPIENKLFTDQIYLSPKRCGDNEDHLMQCEHDGWKYHPDCRRQLQVFCTDVQHFHLPSNQVTWTIVKQFCESLGRRMCSITEIFSFNDRVPIITGIIPGDHWAPISGEEKDWVQVGSSRNFNGLTHSETHSYGVPTWGEVISNGPYKGNFYCCL